MAGNPELVAYWLGDDLRVQVQAGFKRVEMPVVGLKLRYYHYRYYHLSVSSITGNPPLYHHDLTQFRSQLSFVK